MKKNLIITFVLIYSFSLTGQNLDYAKEIVKTLASPKFKGRGYVENGNKIAAEYIKGQYSEIGLKPFKKDYFQSFKVEVNIFPSRMNLYFDGVELIAGKEFIVDPYSPSIKGEYSVHIIKKRDLLDISNVEKAIQSSVGKVLIIDETDFEPENKEEAKKIDDYINFLKYNPRIRSIGTIIYSSEKLTWDNVSIQASKPSFIVNKEVDFTFVKKVTIEIDAKIVNYKTQNIIGYIKGVEQPDTFLFAIGHYDHLGKMGSNTYFPGANDNSSGIAMLLNLAKYYKSNPHKYSFVFIALSAEEIGLLGAKYFVDNPFVDLNKIKFLINFDLAGTGDDGIKVVNGKVYEEKFDILTKLNEENDYLKSVKIRGDACISDHCMFHEKGVPCFYIYTLGGTQAYHDIYDKSETLPLTEFVDYSKLMIDFFNSFK